MGPLGQNWVTASGNPAIGFFDSFNSFHATTLEGPYKTLKGASYTIDQIVDTATEKGILQLGCPGSTANGEAILQWGRGLAAPFFFGDKDLVFECRFSVSALTAAKWSIFAGLALADSTNGACITDANGAAACKCSTTLPNSSTTVRYFALHPARPACMT
jgi:hypothetical protein